MSIPPQSPYRRRPVALRPQNDHPRLPTFRAPMTPRIPDQPIETYDPRNEARPFEWSELTPGVIAQGGLFFGIVGGLLIVALSSLADVRL